MISDNCDQLGSLTMARLKGLKAKMEKEKRGKKFLGRYTIMQPVLFTLLL